ncbi:MAG: FAD-dependent oxidoreductase [Rickettsiales bacterium]|nr:FAD-dependent oxidoreductase [Rickettsiales bacterium]
MSLTAHLKTHFNLTFADLYCRKGLEKLDQKFSQFLKNKSVERGNLIECANCLEEFLVELFNIKKENSLLKKRHDDLQKIYLVRREFVQRYVAKKFNDVALDIDGIKILKDLKISYSDIDDLEKQLADKIFHEKDLEILTKYSTWALYAKAGKDFHKEGALFILPKKNDQQNLIDFSYQKSNRHQYKNEFDLTDKGFGMNRILAEAHYCIFCHKQKKDSCRSGIFEKDSSQLKIDSLKVELHGCPLDEKISEMNLLKSQGFSIAALAVATIDNPMIAGTGHRICNDCMKSCIYQKQDPVDIPQIETATLRDVLALPYGFEIYSLLTRWNPLNLERNLPQKNSGKKILICGLGPSGYTLAHHLLNDGHEVVAIDGLKIEPLNAKISGIDEFGNRQEFQPIKFVDEIYEPLSSRLIQGFGGVAEYGITVRFDKNFLKIIRLLLERRDNFRMFGGIRFGSSITDKIAFNNYEFDHVALCIGAGRPHIINLKNNFAKGVRSASDFLMSLQLSGSFKQELFSNLQIRMPICVIGGGLTAVDTACEAQAYYIIQIRKFADKISKIGKEKIWAILNQEEKIVAEEFLNHALELEKSDAQTCLKKWGGVKIIYRKKIQESPAYRLNHQELNKAIAEGVEFVENVTPLEIEIDEFAHIKNLKCDQDKSFKCASLLIAAGTSPNLAPVFEDGLDFEVKEKYFAEIDQNHHHYSISHSARPKDFSIITKIDDSTKKAVSFFGDLHPNFEGNVVKAMASAKIGHREITKILNNLTTENHNLSKSIEQFRQKINDEFLVRIEKVEKLSNHVFEVFIKAPLLAKQTEVGHIFRLQNYHALAPKISDQLMAMEGVPVTALEIDRELGIISGIVVDYGGSSSLIKNFKAGEPCIFMGPSGKPTEISQNETVVLIGGGRGNQPLTALAQAFSKNNCRVFFFAGYRHSSFIIREDLMKNSCEKLIIAVEEDAQNLYFKGSVVEALQNYFTNNTQKIDRIFTIGNDQMMHQIAKLRHQNLVPSITNAKIAITSLNAPMQCMLKGVCSQCLQKKINQKGEVEYFYACANQDQNMDYLDFNHLHQRCQQNSLAEKVSKLWIKYLNDANFYLK